PFTVRAGAIYFVTPAGTGNGDYATPMSPSAAYTQMGPGKTFYFRGGTYTGGYGDGGVYGDRNYSLGQAKGGTAGNPLALVGYPNEMAQFVSPVSTDRENISLADNSGQPANYVTIANLTLLGGAACVSDGGWYLTPKSGGTNIRVVGNVMSARYGNNNTMTGVILIQNDHWRVLGNEMKDTGTGAPINNNHGIYNQAGASDTEIAWNYFHDLRMGHVIQVHTDPYYVYTNVRIHDNVLTQGANGDSRGINVGNALSGTYGSIYNNILYNVGQNFSGIMIYSGDWKIYNNTLYNVFATSGIISLSNLPLQLGGAPANWGVPTADIRNNIIYSDGQSVYVGAESGASISQATLSNNLYYNFGAAPSQDTAPITGDPLFVNAAAGNFHRQSGSPATNTGTTSVSTVVTMDHDGVNRPQGGGYDVGAYEQ
ncbi:choice-of-anchor Q domain-containing protein, partial [Sulfuricaulis sp.]|uniref:choice-of-anchor Q domain-containing protein n=1 Tax=Sulfuricaulis sp. TaxID=2003553 RepID=UPI0035597D40